MLACVWLASSIVCTAAAGPTLPVESLVGDWYVLVHYSDRAVPDPDPAALQWDDAVWRFEARSRDRLVWTLHPHVTLRDRTGRLDRLPSGAEARTTGAWTPNAAQREQIASGLELDGHEARTKTLRGSSAHGYRSREAARAGSASTIAYEEQWAIEMRDGLPVLSRRNTLASGRADAAVGDTTFRVTRVSQDGAELSGDFDRDGRLVGEFRMIRIHVPKRRAR